MLGRSFIFFSHRALAREGDYEMMPVCVRVCVCALVCHTDFSKTTSTDFFCKLIVTINFHAHEFFFGFMDSDLKIRE